MDCVQIPVLQKGGNLIQGHVKGPEIADGIQTLELPGAVIAVSRLRVGIFRLQKPDLVIMAENTDADMKQAGYLAYLEPFVIFHRLPFFEISNPLKSERIF